MARNSSSHIYILFRFSGLLLLGLLLTFRATAQEKMLPLYQNDALQKLHQPPHKIPHAQFKSGPVVNLPFFDDFSTYTGYPSDQLWLDNYVYVNTSFGVRPPSNGVATFDALNSYGLAYDPGNVFSYGSADTLTSTYIDLSKYTFKDSLYLSFFVQPQGLGESPDEGDSLILEFKPDSAAISYDTLGNPTAWSSTAWIKVWAAEGAGLSPFKEIILPVKYAKDTNFYQNRFQFRFRNMANLSGNLDIWNVDYVYLDRGRSSRDSNFEDVAQYQPPLSLVKGYTSIPWNHFRSDTAAYYTDSVHVFTHSNTTNSSSNPIKHVTFSYQISSLTDNIPIINAPAQIHNVGPNEFLDFKMHAVPLNGYTSSKPDSTVLMVKAIAKNDVAEDVKFRQNDTATLIQNFNTYFAYDDGSAELGYGVQGSPNGGSVAVQFNMQKPDTLFGIGIHFNQSLDAINGETVNLMVWSSINKTNQASESDVPVRRILNVSPQFVKHMNGFYYFPLDTPVFVDKTFYLGWTQTDDFMLNVGFDRNYPQISTGNVLYYKIDNTWSKSKLPGVPMIRAFVGKEPVFASIKQAGFNMPQPEVSLYPNPSHGQFSLNLPENDNFTCIITDMQGKTIYTMTQMRGHVDMQVPGLHQGIYMARITSSAGSQVVKKLVVE